jgi:DHA1 family multidrug resistance protein-like MFS transporter
MSTIIRDAPFGQLVRYLSGNRLFQYPEERPDFILPKAYVDNAVRQKYLPGQGTEEKEPEKNVADLDNAESDSSSSSDSEIERVKSAASQIQRSHSYPGSPDQIQADIELALHKTVSKPIRPARTEDGTLVVDW